MSERVACYEHNGRMIHIFKQGATCVCGYSCAANGYPASSAVPSSSPSASSPEQRLEQIKESLRIEWRLKTEQGIHHDHLSDLAFLIAELEFTQNKLAASVTDCARLREENATLKEALDSQPGELMAALVAAINARKVAEAEVTRLTAALTQREQDTIDKVTLALRSQRDAGPTADVSGLTTALGILHFWIPRSELASPPSSPTPQEDK